MLGPSFFEPLFFVWCGAPRRGAVIRIPNLWEMNEKIRLLKIVVMSLALLSLVSIANASKSLTGTGSFTTSASGANTRTAGENTITDSKFTLTITGILTGTCVGTSHAVMLPTGHSTTQGSCTFTGSVGDSSGTAVLRFRATGQGVSFQGRDVIEHGTAGLAGLHATGTFQGMATGATTSAGTYSTNFHFDPS